MSKKPSHLALVTCCHVGLICALYSETQGKGAYSDTLKDLACFLVLSCVGELVDPAWENSDHGGRSFLAAPNIR